MKYLKMLFTISLILLFPTAQPTLYSMESEIDPRMVEEQLRSMKEASLLPTTADLTLRLKPEVRAFFSNSTDIQKNVVTYSNFDKENDAKKHIQKMLEKNKPMIWWVTSHTQPSNMGQLLQEKGFTPFPLAAIACSLDAVTLPEIALDDIMVIREMKTTDKEWQSIIREAFNHTDDTKKKEEQSFVKNYGLYSANELVCIGSLHIGDTWVGISNLATKKTMRRRGFAKVFATHILKQLKESNIKTAVSMVVPESENLSKGFGFKKVFDLTMYYIQK